MIEIKNLCKSFEEKEVLKNISATFENGRTNLIIGQSGSGKTVLMKNLVGLLDPTSGQVLYDGRDFVAMSKREKIELRREMGMIFQSAALFDSMTVLENVMFPLDMFSNMNYRERVKRAQSCLDRVNLIDAETKYPGEISGGMQKRVAIARAYAVNPSVLLMDEPFGALDAQTRTQLQTELLKTWQEENKTCFFVTHDIEEAIVLASRVVIMSARPGRIKEIIDIDIPHPRDQATKMSPRFVELKNYIWSQVYQEYLEVQK